MFYHQLLCLQSKLSEAAYHLCRLAGWIGHPSTERHVCVDWLAGLVILPQSVSLTRSRSQIVLGCCVCRRTDLVIWF